jgi:outer membrane protein assembly factor BamB
VPGAQGYPATLAADGKVFTTSGSKLLVLDPKTKEVTKTISLPGGQTEISLGRHSSGKLVGLAGGSIYVLDPAKGEIILTEKAPVPIRCGFALTDDAVYFGSGVTLWRYRLPQGL